MSRIKFKLIELKIISVLASTGSMSEASTILGVAQTNISKALSDFEAHIGLKIFDRTTRRISLTQFGEALLPHINEYLYQTNALGLFITDYKQEKRGKVTVLASTDILDFLSQHVIPKFKDTGDINISLRTYNLERNALYGGQLFPADADIVLTYAKPKDESLVASTLTTFIVKAYASPAYLAHHPITKPEELLVHSCILLQSMLINDTNLWQFTSEKGGIEKEFNVSGRYVCDNAKTAIELARHGLGIVFAPQQTVRDDIQRGVLVPCFADKVGLTLDLLCIFKKREFQPYRVTYILDQILNLFSNDIEIS